MKKILKLIILASMLLQIVACRKNQEAPMTIEPAHLTREEENILELVKSEGRTLIYDANLDSKAQSYRVSIYRLKGGVWDLVASNAGKLSNSKLRLAVKFDRIGHGLGLGFLSGESRGNTNYIPEEKIETQGMGEITSRLESLSEITYREEIGLVGQIISKQDSIGISLDDYKDPEKLAEKTYEYVYYIAIEFSDQLDLLD